MFFSIFHQMSCVSCCSTQTTCSFFPLPLFFSLRTLGLRLVLSLENNNTSRHPSTSLVSVLSFFPPKNIECDYLTVWNLLDDMRLWQPCWQNDCKRLFFYGLYLMWIASATNPNGSDHCNPCVEHEIL